MKVQNYNEFTKQWYEYEIPVELKDSPFYSKHVHSLPSPPIQPLCRTMCAYCGYSFESRNKLFHHLGYHGIDIRGSTYNELDMMDKEDSRQRSRKRNRASWWKCKKYKQKDQRHKKKQRMMDVTNIFQTLKI